MSNEIVAPPDPSVNSTPTEANTKKESVLALSREGLTQAQIAKTLQLHPSNVSRILKAAGSDISPDFAMLPTSNKVAWCDVAQLQENGKVASCDVAQLQTKIRQERQDSRGCATSTLEPTFPPDNHLTLANKLAHELRHFCEVQRTPWGWRSQCPVTSCRDHYPGLNFCFAGAGEQVVVRCDSFCKEHERQDVLDHLLESIPWVFERTLVGVSPLPPSQRRSVDALDFLQERIPAPAPLLSPWITEESTSMIYAKTGVGKTWLALFMAHAIATGGELLKWKAKEPQRILYVDGEMSQSDMHNRLALIFAKQKPERDMFGLLCNSRSKEGLLDLSTTEGQSAVENELGDAKVLFLDNITTLFRSGAENEAESWASAERWLMSLRNRRLAVVLLHHSGKNGTQRGTSRREVALNNILRLHGNEGDDCSFEVHFDKARNLTSKDKKTFKASLLTDESGSTVFARSESYSSRKEEILSLREQGLGIREMARKLGIDVAYVSRVLKAAKEL